MTLHPPDVERTRERRRRTILLAAIVLTGCLGAIWGLARAAAEGDFERPARIAPGAPGPTSS
jgi:hypothetical protein